MPDIFLFSDYRAYLRAVYQDRKKVLRPYSYARFSESLGLGDRTFIQHILSGNRDLPLAALAKVCEGLGLDSIQSEHMGHMLGFAIAKNAVDKDYYWRKLRSKMVITENQADLNSQRSEILESWYAIPVKELLCAGVVNAREIQKSFRSALSLDEIEHVIQRLLQLGFVERDGTGQFIDLDPEISVPVTDAFAGIVRQFQHEMMKRSAEVLMDSTPDEREFQTLSMPLSAKAFAEARALLRQSRDELIRIYQNDQSEESKFKIFQCNLTLFPLADLPPKD